MTDLSKAFPVIKETDWIKDRDQCWELALSKGGWKKEYRKTDLEKMKRYFYLGENVNDLASLGMFGVLLDFFPIQSKEGYDYFYANYEVTKRQVEGFFKSAFLDQQEYGMRWKEQRAFFDYHVGSEYEPVKFFSVCGDSISFEISAIERFGQIMSSISRLLRDEPFGVVEKTPYMVPYFNSVSEYLIERGGGFHALKGQLLPKLIARIERDEFLRSGDELEAVRAKVIEEVRPTFLKIKSLLS